jgi:hypothetical protein
MQPPVDFADRLERIFDGRIRARWSNRRQEWHLEYKIARGKATVPFYIDSNDDPAIRARDGYALLMAVRTGDRMPCPRCGYELKVPIFEKAEAICQYCVMHGRDGRTAAVFFPLDGDQLIQYLISLDPLRTYRDGLHKRADANNELRQAARERKFKNEIQAHTLDNYNKLVGIESVGYTGKEFTGDKHATVKTL